LIDKQKHTELKTEHLLAWFFVLTALPEEKRTPWMWGHPHEEPMPWSSHQEQHFCL